MEKKNGIFKSILRACGKALGGVLSFLIPVIGIVRIAKRPRMGVGAKVITSVTFMIFWAYAVSLIYAMGWAFLNSLKLESAETSWNRVRLRLNQVPRIQYCLCASG